MSPKRLLFVFGWFLFATTAHAQSPPTPNPEWLYGRWEVVSYSEQGTQVDKKQDPIPQAIQVYQQIKTERTKRYYGFDAELDDLSRRASRAFRRWVMEDSTREVRRIIHAVETPFVAVFFRDSTLSLYNKDTEGHISNARIHRYKMAVNSLHMEPGPQYQPKWFVQILNLTADRMRLFLPEEASIVELVKTAYILP
ncbi:MAG: hypothetical protein JNN12_15565 [Bacteroidetes Order II. Incertae sedis bacterium]|nr:hypothetical protein [Bacteroidetes Order II. bacterium]